MCCKRPLLTPLLAWISQVQIPDPNAAKQTITKLGPRPGRNHHHPRCPSEGLSKRAHIPMPCCSPRAGWDLCSGRERRRLRLGIVKEAQMHQMPRYTQAPRCPMRHSIQPLEFKSAMAHGRGTTTCHRLAWHPLCSLAFTQQKSNYFS